MSQQSIPVVFLPMNIYISIDPSECVLPVAPDAYQWLLPLHVCEHVHGCLQVGRPHVHKQPSSAVSQLPSHGSPPSFFRPHPPQQHLMVSLQGHSQWQQPMGNSRVCLLQKEQTGDLRLDCSCRSCIPLHLLLQPHAMGAAVLL